MSTIRTAARKFCAAAGPRPSSPTGTSFDAFAAKHFAGGLGGVAILTGASTSPSRNGLMVQAAQRGAGIYLWEPVCRVNEMRGCFKAFGQAAMPQLDLAQAEVIVDFDANFLQDHPTALRNSKQFSAGRKPEAGHMNRLYVYENTFSITGGMADHRFPTARGDIGAAVWALAAELVLGEGLPLPAGAGVTRGQLTKWRGHAAGAKHVAAVAKDLMANRGHGLLVAGMRQDPDTHALLHVLNTALGNVGKTISFLPIEMPQIKFIDELVKDLNTGRIKTLVDPGRQPGLQRAGGSEIRRGHAEGRGRIHLGHRDDATAKLATWHLPLAHYLESWGDAMGWDQSYLAVQPLIAPLYGGKHGHRNPVGPGRGNAARQLHDRPRHLRPDDRQIGPRARGRPGLRQAVAHLHPRRIPEGQRTGQGSDPGSGRGGTVRTPRSRPPGPGQSGNQFRAGPVGVRRSLRRQRLAAGNARLHVQADLGQRRPVQPWPRPPNWVLKHGDLVELEYEGRKLEMAVYVLPGQAKYSVTVNLGYGREDAGRVGQGMGFDTYQLRTWDNLHGGTGLKVTKTGGTYQLATTQDHHAIDAAGAAEIQKRVPSLVREGNIEDYKSDPEFVDHLGVHSPPLKSLWKEWEYTGYKWGMAIDLNACNGCNACVIGCQSENNIPVVGKDEVNRGREMSWVRLDRYFLGDPEDPKVAQQPVACVQCENAPCEQVCPVAATLHTDEGLNAMVYNRCVGTRYCSNNCPYKVRRFNWFNNFEDLTETQRLVLNPDVTVRARGVMEKCTYCVQRIETARVAARVDGRGIQDGDITPACAATCPTNAITFGDLNDPDSRVSKLREASRSYDLLNYLNIKPRTFYMARIRNPNPAIEPATRQHGGGHDAGHGGDHDTHEEHGTEAGAHG